MPEPILAAQHTWWAPTNSSVTEPSITEIEIVDSYTPTGTVTDTWDASAAKDGSVTCYVIGTKLIIAGNGSGKVCTNVNAMDCFGTEAAKAFQNVTTVTGLDIFDTSRTTNMSFFFRWMISVKSLDVKNFNMSNVTTVENMFFPCMALETLDISGWNTSKVINMKSMFSNCNSLQTIIGMDNIDTSSVTNMQGMFYGCKLSSVPMLDTSNITSMAQMFANWKGKSIVLPPWNTSKVTDMSDMFANYGRTAPSPLETVDISNIDTSSVTTMQFMFSYQNNLKSITWGNLSTSRLEQAHAMFAECVKLEEVDVSNWDTSSCVKMSSMFNNCSSIKNLNVSNWDTSSCTDMSFMFYNCSSLGEIDVSNWDTSKVTTLDHFAAHANLKRIGMEKWTTSSLVNANAAFHNCAEEELDLSKWAVSKVQFFCQMFENSPNLKRIKGMGNWDTSAGLGFDGMFERCSKLEELDLSGFNTTKAKNNVSASTNGHKTLTLNNMFLTCNNLEKVTVGPNWSVNGDGTNTTAANKAILPTPSATYIPGADGNWYTFNGDQYAPNAMKDRTAATYYASFDMVADADVIVKNGSLIDTAKAIREKNGMNTQYTPSEFGAAIRAL